MVEAWFDKDRVIDSVTNHEVFGFYPGESRGVERLSQQESAAWLIQHARQYWPDFNNLSRSKQKDALEKIYRGKPVGNLEEADSLGIPHPPGSNVDLAMQILLEEEYLARQGNIPPMQMYPKEKEGALKGDIAKMEKKNKPAPTRRLAKSPEGKKKPPKKRS